MHTRSYQQFPRTKSEICISEIQGDAERAPASRCCVLPESFWKLLHVSAPVPQQARALISCEGAACLRTIRAAAAGGEPQPPYLLRAEPNNAALQLHRAAALHFKPQPRRSRCSWEAARPHATIIIHAASQLQSRNASGCACRLHLTSREEPAALLGDRGDKLVQLGTSRLVPAAPQRSTRKITSQRSRGKHVCVSV